MTTTCVLHGISWQSEVPLPWATTGGDAAGAWRVRSPRIDSNIRQGALGERVAGYERSDESFEVVLRPDDTYVLSFSDLVHFIVDPSARSVQPLCQRPADTALVGLLLANAVSAFLISLGGRTALHASAVIVQNRAVVICGPSNQGKSTVAAALCAAGASLLADDTLAWFDGRPGALARRGVTEIRLRKSATKLAHCLGPPHNSPDGRLVVRPLAALKDPVPIALIVHPNNQSDSVSPQITPLRGATIQARLLSSTRLGSWTAPPQQVNALRDARRLAGLCPSVELKLSLQNTECRQTRTELFQLISDAVGQEES